MGRPGPGREFGPSHHVPSGGAIGRLLTSRGHPDAGWTIVDRDGTVCTVARELPGVPVAVDQDWSDDFGCRLADVLADVHEMLAEGFGPLFDDEQEPVRGSSGDRGRHRSCRGRRNRRGPLRPPPPTSRRRQRRITHRRPRLRRRVHRLDRMGLRTSELVLRHGERSRGRTPPSGWERRSRPGCVAVHRRRSVQVGEEPRRPDLDPSTSTLPRNDLSSNTHTRTAGAATVRILGIHYLCTVSDERRVGDGDTAPDLQTSQQVDPPHFDGLGPHPGTGMGSIRVTGNAARRVGGRRLRFWFRGALIIAFGVLVALLLVL